MKLLWHVAHRMALCLVLAFPFVGGCAALRVDDAAGPADEAVLPRRIQEVNHSVADIRAPISQVREEGIQGLKFRHYACADFPGQQTGRRLDGRSFVEFGVSHIFGDVTVQPYFAYRCD